MHGTFSHFGRPRPPVNVLTEDAMFYAMQAVYPGQAVICGGRPTVVQLVKDGLVWLVGFSAPVPLRSVEAA